MGEALYENPSLGNFGFEMIKFWSRAYSPTEFLFRFQNLDEANNRTVPTEVFHSGKLGAGTVVEMTLNFNQPKADMILNKLNWNG